MASLGTPLRGPAPPPPFVRCLARSLQACFVQPSQGALRAAGATCCISAENSPGARSGTERGTRTELFVCSPSPESWIPWHGFSPPSGFPSCRQAGALPRAAGARLGCCAPAGGSAPAARASCLCVPDPERGLRGTAGGGAGVRRLRPEGTQVGEWRTNRAEIRSSHTLPPGMQAGKEETAEEGQTPAGGGGDAQWLRVWSARARDAK